MTIEQAKQFQDLQAEQAELQTELKRIDGFLNREPDNKDNTRAINQGRIFVKFAGTACNLPYGIFTAELTKRKKAVEDRLVDIETELTNL